MSERLLGASALGVLGLAMVLTSDWASAQQSSEYQTPGDVPLCIAPADKLLPQGEILVGYASGRVVRLDFAGGRPHVAWEGRLEGGVLAVMEISRQGETGREVIASTDDGIVACFRGHAAQPAWRFKSTCEVSCLAEFPDVNGDGAGEVVAGGADHRVHLLNGRTGEEIWGHLFESQEGYTYVTRLLVTPDQDGDAMPEVVVWMWSGELAVLSGPKGKPIWRKQIGDGFTDGLAAASDLNSDGVADFVVGGNDRTVRACSGRDGAVLWSGRVDRPIRDIAVTGTCAYVCTSGGQVARFDFTQQDSSKHTADMPRWKVNLGDVCRDVVVTADVDTDGVPDAAACAENGVVAILSGQSGLVLRRWQAGDVVRAIYPVSMETKPYLAATSLDGMVRLLPAAAGDLVDSRPETALTRPAPLQQVVSRGTLQPPTSSRPAAVSASASGSPRVIILLYHDVLPEVFYHYATSVANFKAQMDMLVQEKYVCVSLDQIADWIEGKGDMPDRAVCITFDGPYQGHYTHAYPILRERGLFATSYITTDWIGTANHADWHQLREMDATGVMVIENHTINHPSLTKCDRSEVVVQLQESNEAIRRHMGGKTSRHHAYPSGLHNPQVRAIMRELGFRTATTVRPGPVSPQDDLMNLPRYMLCTHKTLEQFRAWLIGEEAAATAGPHVAN